MKKKMIKKVKPIRHFETIVMGPLSTEGRDNWDRIFGDKNKDANNDTSK